MIKQQKNKKSLVILQRDTVAMMVPSGARIMLHKGTEVTITQSLGNAYTVNVYGNLARIDNKDADALGQTVAEPLQDLPQDATVEERVTTLLKTVYDPEIPVNIVDLGLIYNCQVIAKDQEGGEAALRYDVRISMTLTAPGCGMGPVIVGDVQNKINSLPEVDETHVEMVFDPPWDRSRMSEYARLELGML